MLAAWIDGECIDRVPVSDRALHYGDAAFTTIRVHQSRACWLVDHLQRLQDACRRLYFPPFDWRQLQDEIEQACVDDGVGVLKVLLSRGDGQRGYAPTGALGRRMIFSYARTEAIAAHYQHGFAIRIAQIRLSEQPALAGLKHANRLEQVLALAEPEHRDVHEALLLDAQGRLISATAGNVFVRMGQSIMTPLLHRAGVAGTCRRRVLNQSLPGISMSEADLPSSLLMEADEIFVCNAVRGIVPVAKLGNRELLDHRFAHALMRGLHPELGLPIV